MDSVGDNTALHAAPARMDHSDATTCGDDDRDAVGHENRDCDTGLIRDQRVDALGIACSASHNGHVATMDLLHEHDSIDAQGASEP